MHEINYNFNSVVNISGVHPDENRPFTKISNFKTEPFTKISFLKTNPLQKSASLKQTLHKNQRC